MQHCKICRIDFRGEKGRCPLCGGPLSGEPSESAYPVLGHAKISRLSMARIASSLTVLYIIVMATLAVRTGFRHPWMLLSIIPALVLWVDLLLNAHYQHNVLKLLSMQTYIIIGVSILVDWFAGWRAWSVTWVVPFAFLALALITLIVARAMRLRLYEYIFYLVFNALLSLVQLVFLALRLPKHVLPIYITMGILVLGALLAIILRWREWRIAAEKVFHA